MPLPRAILLDLDDTLLDDRGAMATAVLRFRTRHAFAAHLDDAMLSSRWDSVGRELWKKLASGELSFEAQRRHRLREVFELSLADSEADALFADYLDAYRQCWALLPGAKEFLSATSSIPRVLVTNGRREQALRKLQSCGMDAAFHAVVTPDDCGCRKPDSEIFRFALRLLDCAPADAMMIGDNLEADIAPASALGMSVFHVDARTPGRTIRDAIPPG